MKRQILYINKKNEKEKISRLRTLAVMNKIKLVTISDDELESLPDDAELLKMIDFGNTVQSFLMSMKKAGIRVDYKCIETDTNRGWSLSRLYEEVRLEHEEMNKRG